MAITGTMRDLSLDCGGRRPVKRPLPDMGETVRRVRPKLAEPAPAAEERPASILDLPSDVLQTILLLTIEEQAHKAPGVLLPIARVCKRLRDELARVRLCSLVVLQAAILQSCGASHPCQQASSIHSCLCRTRHHGKDAGIFTCTATRDAGRS